jgi:hypothetical protein
MVRSEPHLCERSRHLPGSMRGGPLTGLAEPAPCVFGLHRADPAADGLFTTAYQASLVPPGPVGTAAMASYLAPRASA